MSNIKMPQGTAKNVRQTSCPEPKRTASEKRPSEIVEVLSRLNSVCESLLGRTVGLRDSLTSVLRARPETSPCDIAESAGYSTPLANHILNLTCRLEEIDGIVADTGERLDIS